MMLHKTSPLLLMLHDKEVKYTSSDDIGHAWLDVFKIKGNYAFARQSAMLGAHELAGYSLPSPDFQDVSGEWAASGTFAMGSYTCGSQWDCKLALSEQK